MLTNGNGHLSVGKILTGFVSSLILVGAGAIISATLGDAKEVAGLKVKADIHDAQIKRQDDRLDRIESKIDRILERVAREK